MRVACYELNPKTPKNRNRVFLTKITSTQIKNPKNPVSQRNRVFSLQKERLTVINNSQNRLK
ncbi:hypothetical protein WN50_15535 [Limnoraphis robusta CS-951]|uniref:Uncharacterized protein n=1 Tax=Limnoraphis robusta CS-951 TaxID=1637645 RepID=A0A0F5YEB4_9CYAN|nr:hypothetical protein WN50_15535 [Limnoraphis robusta CS-951]